MVTDEIPTVYLAGPIDQAGGHKHGVDLMRADARRVLLARGAVVYDPSFAWATPAFDGRALPPSIQSTNDRALLNSDGLLALLPVGVPTVGVPMEIALALQHGIPTVVVADPIPTALAHTEAVVRHSPADAADLIVKMAERTDRWATSLLFTKTDERATIPTRAYTGDAGYDLYVLDEVEIPAGAVVDVPSGIAVAIPVGHYGRIVGRSSTFRKRRLSVVEGVIDAGYRGPLFSCVWNPNSEPIKIAAGDRVAQLIVTPVSDLTQREVGALPASDRGDRGFGSSGTGRLDR